MDLLDIIERRHRKLRHGGLLSMPPRIAPRSHWAAFLRWLGFR
jgi:hypothetical protein